MNRINQSQEINPSGVRANNGLCAHEEFFDFNKTPYNTLHCIPIEHNTHKVEKTARASTKGFRGGDRHSHSREVV
jgi:hypothetical protein